MTTTQSLVTERLRHEAEVQGWQFADDRLYANKGSYRFYNDSFELVAEINYDFQHGYFTFTAEGLDSDHSVRSGNLGLRVAQLVEYLEARA